MSRGGRATDVLLLATVLTVSFAKLQWNVAGALSLSDVLTAVFLVVFAWSRLEHSDGKLSRAAAIALAPRVSGRSTSSSRLIPTRATASCTTP